VNERRVADAPRVRHGAQASRADAYSFDELAQTLTKKQRPRLCGALLAQARVLRERQLRGLCIMRRASLGADAPLAAARRRSPRWARCTRRRRSCRRRLTTRRRRRTRHAHAHAHAHGSVATLSRCLAPHVFAPRRLHSQAAALASSSAAAAALGAVAALASALAGACDAATTPDELARTLAALHDGVLLTAPAPMQLQARPACAHALACVSWCVCV
jgi:hypothetical protein